MRYPFILMVYMAHFGKIEFKYEKKK